MVSVYMPDVKVEVAFNAGFTTPAASRTWTDVSAYVELEEGIDIGGGRSDARGTIDANTLSLSVDNSDGRFTPYLTTGAYYPNVKIGRPIRVTAKPAGSAVTSTRFLGYVDSWPTEWSEGVTQYAVARITAATRLARIGRTGTLLSVVEEEHLPDSPLGYWTMGDPEGATQAVDSSGNGGALTQAGSGTAVTFGTATGPGTDDLTAASFAGGKFLSAAFAESTLHGLSTFVLMDAAPGAIVTVVGGQPFDAHPLIAIVGSAGPGPAGSVRALMSGVAVTGPVITDGLTHHVAVTMSADEVTVKLYVDGVLVDTDTGGTGATPSNLLTVGGALDATMTGVLAHVAMWSADPSARIADHAASGLTGFAGESAFARATRYARWGGALTADVSIDAGAATPMQAIDSTGKTTGALLRLVEATEGGVLFDSRAGLLTYLSRTARFNRTADITLAVDSLEAGTSPRLDDSELVNRATATVTDDLSVSANDFTSQDAYGLYDLPFEILTTNRNEAEGRCWWTVNQYGEPAIRVPNLTVDVLPLSLAQQDLLAAVDIGDRIATSGSWPAQIGTVLAAGFFVEGYAERFGPESWEIGFNVSPASISEVMRLNHATYGALGSYPLAY